jgi:hypothetical protein
MMSAVGMALFRAGQSAEEGGKRQSIGSKLCSEGAAADGQRFVYDRVQHINLR